MASSLGKRRKQGGKLPPGTYRKLLAVKAAERADARRPLLYPAGPREQPASRIGQQGEQGQAHNRFEDDQPIVTVHGHQHSTATTTTTAKPAGCVAPRRPAA